MRSPGNTERSPGSAADLLRGARDAERPHFLEHAGLPSPRHGNASEYLAVKLVECKKLSSERLDTRALSREVADIY